MAEKEDVFKQVTGTYGSASLPPKVAAKIKCIEFALCFADDFTAEEIIVKAQKLYNFLISK